jgi:hypothetical protein
MPRFRAPSGGDGHAVAPARRLFIAAVALAALALLLATSAAFGASAAPTPARLAPLPPAEELAELTSVHFTVVAGERLQPWELAYRLEHGADAGATPLRRHWWGPLATALATFDGPTPQGQAVAVRVSREAAWLVRSARDDGRWDVVAYLPAAAVRRGDGRYRLALASDFQRTRNTTREVTTLPLQLRLEIGDEPAEDRRWELRLVGERELIRERSRAGLEDANGEPIRFRDVEAEDVQDRTAAGLHGGHYWSLSRGGRFGRVDVGATAGVDWEEDPLDFLAERWKPYLGGSLRLTSEEVDDLRLEIGLRLGGNFERFAIVEPVTDETGAVVGTTVLVEENDLPTWELVFTGAAPLYRAGGTSLLLLEGQASWLQSLEKTGGDATRPAKTERITAVEAGLRFLTPLGASVVLRGKLETFDLPGEAARRIEDYRWSSGVSANLQLAW